MEKTYAVEFSELQQSFHFNDGTSPSAPNDWETIIEHCTLLEAEIFLAYVNGRNNLLEDANHLRKYASQLTSFINQLTENKLQIVRI